METTYTDPPPITEEMKELFHFLTTRAAYYVCTPLTVKEKQEKYLKSPTFDPWYFSLTESYIPPLQVPLPYLEEFLGQPYSSHLVQPLIDAGWINIHYVVRECLPCSVHSTLHKLDGIVKNYETDERFFRFYLGPVNPNVLRGPIQPWDGR
jgi:hypothetical protein